MATRADSLPPFIATPPVPTPRLAEFANDNVATDASSPFDTAWRRYASALPTDAFAIIEPDPLAGRSGGRAREGRWRLRFRPRSRPFVDPLTGWTGGSDTLAHLELGFPSREAAEAYCRRYGLYESRGAPRDRGSCDCAGRRGTLLGSDRGLQRPSHLPASCTRRNEHWRKALPRRVIPLHRATRATWGRDDERHLCASHSQLRVRSSGRRLPPSEAGAGSWGRGRPSVGSLLPARRQALFRCPHGKSRSAPPSRCRSTRDEDPQACSM